MHLCSRLFIGIGIDHVYFTVCDIVQKSVLAWSLIILFDFGNNSITISLCLYLDFKKSEP